MSTLIFVLSFLAWAQHAEKIITGQDIVGTWSLETVAGKPPSSINIKTWRITFATNQQWTYGGEMDGRVFSGLSVNGDGTWKIVSGELEYTAGNRRGKSKVTIRDSELTLTMDPVLTTPGGKTFVVTTYKRSQGQ